MRTKFKKLEFECTHIALFFLQCIFKKYSNSKLYNVAHFATECAKEMVL